MADAIPKAVLTALKQIGEETGKELVSETGKVVESIISGRELLGDLTTMSPSELQRAKMEDEQKKRAEMEALKNQMKEPGRNVESEMVQIHKQEEEKEKQEEEAFLEHLRQQREAERAEMEAAGEEPVNQQRQKAKMQNMPRGKKKAMMPDPTSMSATSEFKGGKID